MKRIPILPTLVTLGNAFFGFVSIGYVLKAHALWVQGDLTISARYLSWAGWCILFAMVFDALDGKVARLTHATSDFGTQLDSLCDVISFGVAPAVIIKTLAEQQLFLPRIGWATGILFMCCAALRLARFNVETAPEEEHHRYFSGLPSPAAAGFIATLTILVHELRGGEDPDLAGLGKVLEPYMDGLLYAMPFVAVILALLMISRVRYVHVVTTMLRASEPLDYLVKIILIALLAVLTRPFSLPLIVAGYVLSGIVMWIKEQVFHHLPAHDRPGE